MINTVWISISDPAEMFSESSPIRIRFWIAQPGWIAIRKPDHVQHWYTAVQTRCGTGSGLPESTPAGFCVFPSERTRTQKFGENRTRTGVTFQFRQEQGSVWSFLILEQEPNRSLKKWLRPPLVQTRDDHGAGVPEWTPAGVCISGWNRSRSQYFRFEPEQYPGSVLRSVLEPIEIFEGPNFQFFEGPNFCNDACCCQTKWNYFYTCFLTSVVIYHESVILGESTEHFTINDGFKVMA